MLGKRFRLPIQQFPNKNKTLYSGNTVTIKFTNNNLGYNRVGVIVGRGVVRGAVQRNKIKRLVFNFFKDKTNPPSGVGRDILVIYKKKNAGVGFEKTLIEELIKALPKLEN